MNNIITDILKEYKDEIIAFASEVVKTKSLTCQEGEVASIIAGKMEELGYDEVTIDDMGNVLGRIGSGDAKLMFDSHMDTVVVNDEQLWSVPPFSGEIKDGKLYGRGASDMKCGLVASVFGAFAAKKAGLLGDGAIYVSASSMEEDYDGDAVKYLLNKTGLRPDGVVICEPTSLRIATGHRGRALIEVKAEGRGCHASTPELGKNPVYMLRPVIDCVEKLAEELSKRTGEHGSVALTNIYCTTASNNSVPQDATIILDRRLALGESEEIIGKEMDKLVEGFEGVSWTFCDSSIPSSLPGRYHRSMSLSGMRQKPIGKCWARMLSCLRWDALRMGSRQLAYSIFRPLSVDREIWRRPIPAMSSAQSMIL